MLLHHNHYTYNCIPFFQTTTIRECCVGLRGGGYAQAGAESGKSGSPGRTGPPGPPGRDGNPGDRGPDGKPVCNYIAIT